MSLKKLFLLVALLGSLSFAGTCYHAEKTKAKALVVSEKDPYDKLWAKVDSLDKLGLTRSALDVVATIYKKAKQENNLAQTIKAISKQVKLEAMMEEDSREKSIYFLQDEIKRSTGPLRNVLHSLLAEAYWNYYAETRWQFM